MKRRVVGVVVAGAGVAAALVCLHPEGILWGWTRTNIKASELIGDSLITEIRQFERDNGRLPAKLEELTPRYLKSIPPPRGGERRWVFHLTGDGTTFFLGFGIPSDGGQLGYPKCFYESGYGSWYLDE